MQIIKRYLIISLLVFALILTGAWGVSLNEKNRELSRVVMMGMQGDFEEFYEDLNVMSSSLKKALASGESEYTVNMLRTAGERAAAAKEALSRLPVSQEYAGGIQSILSKAEQFSASSLREFLYGRDLSEQDISSLRAVYTASEIFLSSLSGFYEEMYNNDPYCFSEGLQPAFAASGNKLSVCLKNAGEENYDMPEMNYDGKYSSHIDESEYKGISGSEMSAEDIRLRLAENIGEGWEITISGEGKGDLPTHSFTATDGENRMDVIYSKTGGNLISASTETFPDKSVISVEEAKKKAGEFIEKLIGGHMQAEYYEKYNNILSVTFAHSHNGIKCLSDTITVQVSLKDGKIAGYSAESYYKNHTSREDISPQVSFEEAAEVLSEEMNVVSSSLCLLPSEGTGEDLCYEFLTEHDSGEYLVYVDARTKRHRAVREIFRDGETFKVVE